VLRLTSYYDVIDIREKRPNDEVAPLRVPNGCVFTWKWGLNELG
jgi:hypothetical protein